MHAGPLPRSWGRQRFRLAHRVHYSNHQTLTDARRWLQTPPNPQNRLRQALAYVKFPYLRCPLFDELALLLTNAFGGQRTTAEGDPLEELIEPFALVSRCLDQAAQLDVGEVVEQKARTERIVQFPKGRVCSFASTLPAECRCKSRFRLLLQLLKHCQKFFRKSGKIVLLLKLPPKCVEGVSNLLLVR
jgi:hypothetical protein